MTEIASIDNRLIAAARARKWNYIDTELVPKLGGVDGNIVATKLLEKANDRNPDIRDVVATTFSALTIIDRRIFSDVVGSMIRMATTDSEKFPAGRAVMFLWKYRRDEELGDEIKKGIDKFVGRKEIKKWKNDLITDIPEFEDLVRFRMVG